MEKVLSIGKKPRLDSDGTSNEDDEDYQNFGQVKLIYY
jgi:hypothetical protein